MPVNRADVPGERGQKLRNIKTSASGWFLRLRKDGRSILRGNLSHSPVGTIERGTPVRYCSGEACLSVTRHLLKTGGQSVMAVVVVEVPPEFKRYAGGGNLFEQEGSNVGEVLDGLLLRHPDLKVRLMNDRGELYSYLPIFLNQDKLPERGYRSRVVNDGDRLEVIAIASGG
jgi:hypothetical protein